MRKITIIEDNTVYCDYVGNLLAKSGVSSDKIYSLSAAKEALLHVNPDDIILSDFRFPDGDCLELLLQLRNAGHRNPFFIMTDYDEVPAAVRSMKSGATDYVSKMALENELLPILCEMCKKKSYPSRITEQIYDRDSNVFRRIHYRISLVAPTDMGVLILGENGTGKDHLAKEIHKKSCRADMPYVAVDCSVLTPALAASILFGHEKGSFTGATVRRTGYFGEADGGTLFLDEVGNLPLEVQQMLLRAIQNRTYRPVGGNRDLTADVRIIAATNENLETEIEGKRFRQDLYYRLREFIIEVPPLRECREDILPLADYFLKQMNAYLKKSVIGFDDDAKNMMLNYHWYGNVRELKQVVQSTVLITGDGMITIETLEKEIGKTAAANNFALTDENMQRERIINALRQSGSNRRQAARLLGISPPTLYKKMEQYNIL